LGFWAAPSQRYDRGESGGPAIQPAVCPDAAWGFGTVHIRRGTSKHSQQEKIKFCHAEHGPRCMNAAMENGSESSPVFLEGGRKET